VLGAGAEEARAHRRGSAAVEGRVRRRRGFGAASGRRLRRAGARRGGWSPRVAASESHGARSADAQTGTGKGARGPGHPARPARARRGRSWPSTVAHRCRSISWRANSSAIAREPSRGADEHRAGLFEVADGGTLFLDEIGELPKAAPAPAPAGGRRSGEIRRVGGQPSAARSTCGWSVPPTGRSTTWWPPASVPGEDLLFRINTFEIQIPLLRDRLEDLPQLIQHFVGPGRPHLPAARGGSAGSVAVGRHRWPVNVRELAM